MRGQVDEASQAPAAPAATILVVEDEPPLREVLARYLERAGYRVRTAGDGMAALRLAEAALPDLVVLDRLLPGLDGLAVCGRLRERSAVPIILVTACGDEYDTVLGFGLGADDYLVKPISPRELVARVQAVLRRTRPAAVAPAGAVVVVGDLIIDHGRHTVHAGGRPVALTPLEFRLLSFLARHPRQVFTRQHLLDCIWGPGAAGDASTVTVRMRHLRDKLAAGPGAPRHLTTVWGVGYRFDP
jgi:DNA-binding response OmpR family regulator